MTEPAQRIWALLLALARRASAGRPVVGEVGLRLDDEGVAVEVDAADAWVVARPASRRGWSWPDGAAAAAPEVERLLDLYLPLCVGEDSGDLVIGHLAQSLDGRIATASGRSQFITCQDNLVHAHRLRALCDVVLVGSRTVREDNPQLTTRHVPGPNAVRVIVDPHCRLGTDYRVFSDGVSRTLMMCAPEAARRATHHGRAELVATEARDGQLSVTALLGELRRRGLRRIFIEGGGVTVSSFLQARALTRLQLAVAPLVLGSGRPTLSLPVIENLSEALLLDCRHFAMGRDMLFDCILSPPARKPAA
jgi:diaminohydroxyphosphoribosylaminopyrimidine deaminase / 5-amino-6-(5-phosphoribosylamino)uracil reductase